MRYSLRMLLLLAAFVSSAISPAFGDSSGLLYLGYQAQADDIIPSKSGDFRRKLHMVVRDNDEKKRLRAHCKKQSSIWVWPDIGPLICKKIQDASSVDTLEIDVDKPIFGQPTSAYVLLSTRPFPKQNWSLNSPTASEITAAKKLSKLVGKDRQILNADQSIKVLKAANNTLTFLILPYKHIPAEPSSAEDLDARGDYFVYGVFLRKGKVWDLSYEYASDEQPKFLGDLDGDGVPEVERRPYCDGDCIYYDSFFPVRRTLVEHNVHG